MLYAVPPFGMSRIKRTQVCAAFCFSSFCFFRSTHVNKNAAASFFIIRYTYRLRAKCQPFTHAKNTRTQKDNSILRYSPRAVKRARFALYGVWSHRGGSIPIFSRFFVFCTLVFKKRPPFSSILYGKLSFGVFISCFFRKILTFWNFPIEKYTNLVYIYLAEERICVSRPINPKCVFCSLTKNTIRKVLIKLWITTARRSSMRITPLPLPSPLRCLRLCCRTTPNATATRQACMRSARLQKSRLRKHVQK